MTVQVADDNACSWLDQAKDLTDKWKEIHSPLLNELNDEIVFYARIQENKYLELKDDGETYANLDMAGHELLDQRLSDIASDFGEDMCFTPRPFNQITWVGDDTDRPAAFNRFAICLAACQLETPIDDDGELKYD